jgi:hypothetical protein
LTFDAPTGPQAVTWYDASGRPIVGDHASHAGNALMHYSFVIGDRLILVVDAPKGHEPGGVAWIRPAIAEARIAWPVITKHVLAPEGVAVRDANTFSLILHSARDTPSGAIEYLTAGIAGRNGWVRPPVTVAEWVDNGDPMKGGRPLLLGMSWIDGELEVALTHPTAEDPYGSSSPVQIARISAAGQPVVRSQSLGCDCNVIGALPRDKHWTLVVRKQAVMLSDPDGSVRPAPQLAGWDEHDSDRSALGTLWAASARGENRVARDGTISQPAPPLPGWKPIVSFERYIWLDGAVHQKRLWSPDGESLDVLAQEVGDRAILTASFGEDLQLVGDRIDRLRPTIYNSTSYGFQIGEMLPRAGGGFYWTRARASTSRSEQTSRASIPCRCAITCARADPWATSSTSPSTSGSSGGRCSACRSSRRWASRSAGWSASDVPAARAAHS